MTELADDDVESAGLEWQLFDITFTPVDLDFSDTALVIEAEAEKLSQMLSRLLLRPRHGRDEAVFG